MATMLHWLAGAKQGEAANDSSACVDPPETPAPVFAVRAFRHALFGTPQTAQRPQPRRHSTAENRPRNGESPKPTRPRMDRPKSANDANALMPPASPTKGILMTPGTAAAKKKNVTFGDHVVDNQEKRPLKSGLPDDCPGKFPSPWNKSTADGEKDAPAERSRGRNKLTEALEQARDESRQRKGQSEAQRDEDARSGSPARENECCAYWRREYEVYRTNTQREVKKLVKKYKAAKDYAQSKDDEASDARLQQQEAETKADALEEAVNILTAQIKELEEQVREQPQAQHESQQQQKKEMEALVPSTQNGQARDRPRDLQAFLERRGSKDRTVSASTARTNENDQLQRPSEARPTSSRRAEEKGGELQQRWRALNNPAAKREDVAEQPEQKVASKEGEQLQPARPVRAPATIAARRAAEHEQPHATDEAPKRSTIPARPRRQPSALTTASTARPEPQNQNEPRTEPAPTAITTNKTSPPPPESTDLFLPSEPAVYSPPHKSHKTTSNADSTAPTRQHSSHHQQPTAESVPDSPPPPPPPAHGPNTLPIRPLAERKRQDSGLGGAPGTGTGTGTLKPMSANARSGSTHSVGGGNGGNGVGEGEKRVGRDGKEIDAARLEAARARIKARGREVS